MCKVCNNNYAGCPACEPDGIECHDCWGDGIYLVDDDGVKYEYRQDFPDYLSKCTCRTCWGSGIVDNPELLK